MSFFKLTLSCLFPDKKSKEKTEDKKKKDKDKKKEGDDDSDKKKSDAKKEKKDKDKKGQVSQVFVSRLKYTSLSLGERFFSLSLGSQVPFGTNLRRRIKLAYNELLG